MNSLRLSRETITVTGRWRWDCSHRKEQINHCAQAVQFSRFSNNIICCWLLLEQHYVPDAIPTHAAKVFFLVVKAQTAVALRGSYFQRIVQALRGFLCSLQMTVFENLRKWWLSCWIVNIHRWTHGNETTRSQSTPYSSQQKEYSNINKPKKKKKRLSGIHYNIVHGFLSLKGLSEAGMPMRRGSFLACSLQ